MDELYRAKLTAEPPHLHSHTQSRDKEPVRILPHPEPHVGGPSQPQPQPIPIHLPSIYVNPYPPPAPEPAERNSRLQSAPPENPPHGPRPHERSAHGTGRIHVGPWRVSRPHPLLWLCLGLSILALILEVPKGSLPTLTGRHKALRARERLLDERLRLLSHLSLFLPPPLSTLLSPNTSGDSSSPLPLVSIDDHPALRFWNTGALNALRDDGQWWSVQDLGQGASVVRSKGHGVDHKEVWVLSVGEGEGDGDRATLNALTHSLLLRDRLLTELEQVKATPCPVQPAQPALVDLGSESRGAHGDDGIGQRQREEWERIEERTRRDRLREKEVEEREKEVGRREKWVVDEMRKLSDKVHTQATELTLEDRITERLKAYQRQLAAHEEHVHQEL